MFEAELLFLSDGATFPVYLRRKANRVSFKVVASLDNMTAIAERVSGPTAEVPLVTINMKPMEIVVAE